MSFLQIFKKWVKQRFKNDISNYLKVEDIEKTIEKAKKEYNKNKNNKELKTDAAFYQMMKDLFKEFDKNNQPWSEKRSLNADELDNLWRFLFEKVSEYTINDFFSWQKEKTRKNESRFKYIPFNVSHGKVDEPDPVYYIQVQFCTGWRYTSMSKAISDVFMAYVL